MRTLREIRQAAGLSQQKAADVTGGKGSWVAAAENSKNPTLETMRGLARTLGANLIVVLEWPDGRSETVAFPEREVKVSIESDRQLAFADNNTFTLVAGE